LPYFLFVNHKPRIKDDKLGFWRGAELWPFLKVRGAADDKDLSKNSKLKNRAF